MVYIDKRYWGIALLAFIIKAQEGNEEAQKFLRKELIIDEVLDIYLEFEPSKIKKLKHNSPLELFIRNINPGKNVCDKFLKALQLVGLITILKTMGKRELRLHAGNSFSPAIYELFRLINRLEPQNNWLQPDLDGITVAINENQIITLTKGNRDD